MEKSTVNLVKAYRIGVGLTQEQMADVLGIHVNTYRTLEDNPSRFSVEQAKKFIAEINKYDSVVTIGDVFLI